MPNATQKLNNLANGLREVKSESKNAEVNVQALADAIDRISRLAPRLETGELGNMKEELRITEVAVRALDMAFREFGRSRTFINARQDVIGLVSELNIANNEQRELIDQWASGFAPGRLTDVEDTIRRISNNVNRLKRDLQDVSRMPRRTTSYQEEAERERILPRTVAIRDPSIGAYTAAEVNQVNQRLSDQALILKDVRQGVITARQAYQELLGLAGGEAWQLVTPDEVALIAEHTTNLDLLANSLDIVSAAEDALLTKHEQSKQGFTESIEVERAEQQQIERLVQAYDALIQRAEELAIARRGTTVTVSRDPLSGVPLEVQRRLPPTPNLTDIRNVEQSYFNALKGFPQNLVEELLGTETEAALGKRLEQIFGERGVMTRAIMPVGPRDVLVIEQAAAAMDRLAAATERVIRLGGATGGGGIINLGTGMGLLPPGQQPTGLLGGPPRYPQIPASVTRTGVRRAPWEATRGLLGPGAGYEGPLGYEGSELETAASVLQELDQYQDELIVGLKERAAATREATQAQQGLTQASVEEMRSRGEGAGRIPPTIGGERIPADRAEEFKRSVTITGSAEQVKKALEDQHAVADGVEAAINKLKKQYEDAADKTGRFKIEIDAANQAIKVHGDLIKTIPAPSGFGPGETIVTGQTEQLVTNLQGEVITKTDEIRRAFRQMGRTEAFANLSREVDRLGLSFDNLGPIQRDANEGLHRFNFLQKDALGATTRTTLTLDQHGKVAETVKSKYETLGGAITNNINKVLRWAVAVGLVYGTYRRLQQAVTDMIDLQYSLADIQIITGRTAEELGESLDTVAEAAERTGTTLTDAISGYEKALRAAGEYGDESVRIAKANELLGDALVYARLSGLDVTAAIDTLTGAMRQANIEIGESGELLDKWVAVSKEALVNTADLGESFAITAAQALAVGVSIDQLNGLIGTIAKTTTLSSTEIGNLGRRILSTYERPEALEALEQHGVAIVDLEGNYRNFFDVVQDVYDLFRAGAISEKELSQIGAAFGGGARGGPQVVAIIKQWGEANRLAAVSAQADGDATEALNIKMDTLRGTTQELTVALSKLITTAGGEGGFLTFLSSAVKFVTWLVDLLGDLTSALSSTTAQLVTFGAAYIAISKANLPGRLGGGLTTALAGIPGRPSDVQRRLQQYVGGEASGRLLGEGAISAIKTGAKFAGYGIGSAAITYMSTGSAAQAVGAGIGAGIGGVLSGPVGAIAGQFIGSIVGESFESSLRQSDLARKLARDFSDDVEIDISEATQYFTDLAHDLRDLGDVISGRGPIAFGQTFFQDWQDRRPEDVLEFARAFVAEQRATLPEWVTDPTLEGAQAEFARGIIDNVEMQERLLNALEDNSKAVEENTDALEEPEPAAFALRRAETERRYQPGIETALEQQRVTNLQQFVAGDAARGDYLRFLQNQQAIPGLVVRMIDTMGEQIIDSFGEGQGAIEGMAIELSKLDPEALKLIGEQVGELEALQRAIDEVGEVSGITQAELMYQAQLAEDMGSKGSEAMQLILGLLAEIERQAQTMIPTGFARLPEDLTETQINQLIDQARQNQAEFAKFMMVSPKLLQDQAEDFVRVWGGTYHKIEGLHQNFFEDVLRQFQEAQEAMQEQPFSVRRLQDVGPERFGEIQARNRYWIEFLARLQGMSAQQYVQEEGFVENLILGPNNVWQKILTTSEAMNFTLQDILETEKKQLEGMWNIPEGATFWVPITSLFYQRQQQAPAVPELPPLEDITPVEDITAPGAITTRDIIAPEEVWLSREEAMARFGIPEPTVGADDTNQRLYELVVALREMALERDMDPQEFAKMFLGALEAVEAIGEGTMDLLGDLAPGLKLEERLGEFWEGLREKLDISDDAYDLLKEAAQQLSGEAEKIAPDADQASSLLQGGQDALMSAQEAYSSVNQYFTNPPPISMDITLETEKELIVHNIINLDGAFIKRFVSEILAAEIVASSRASGANVTLKS
jgi:TP901 family phage tail tape measure protein